MSLCIGLMAIGGFLYLFETYRPVTYLKKSRKARRQITVLKCVIVLLIVALLFATQIFFIDKLIF